MNAVTFASNIAIHLSSIIFFLFLVIIYFRKNAKNSLKNRLFHIMCYLGIIEFILELSNILLLNYYVKNLLIIGIKKTYYLCFFAILLLWIYYVCILTIERNKKLASFVKMHIGEIRIFIIMLIVSFGIIDYCLPLNFIFDQYGRINYMVGGIIPILGILSAFFSILPVPLIIINRKELIVRKFLPYFVTIILEILVIIIHNFRPELSLLCFANTILFYFIYYRLENPDIVFVRRFKRNSERMKYIREQYSFLFNMTPELKALLNEIAVQKDGYLIDKSKPINKKKLERLLNDFIKTSCGEAISKKAYDDEIEILSFEDDEQSDEMLITKEIYSLNELQDVLKDNNLPKW